MDQLSNEEEDFNYMIETTQNNPGNIQKKKDNENNENLDYVFLLESKVREQAKRLREIENEKEENEKEEQENIDINQIEAVFEENREIKEKNVNLSKINSELFNKLEEYKKSLENISEDFETLLKEKNALSLDNKELKEKIKEMEIIITNNGDDKNKDKYEEKLKENERLRSQLENLISENESLRAGLVKLESTCSNKDLDINKKYFEGENKCLKCIELEEKYNQVNQQLDQVVKDSSPLLISIDSLKATNVSQEKKINLLSCQLAEAESAAESAESFKNEVVEKLKSFDMYVERGKLCQKQCLENVLKLSEYLEKIFIISNISYNPNITDNIPNIKRIIAKINIIFNLKDYNIQLNDDLFFETINEFIFYIYNEISKIFRKCQDLYSDKFLKENRCCSIYISSTETKGIKKEEIETINQKFSFLENNNKSLNDENNKLKKDILIVKEEKRKINEESLDIKNKYKQCMLNLKSSETSNSLYRKAILNIEKLFQSLISSIPVKDMAHSILEIISLKSQMSKLEISKVEAKERLETIKGDINLYKESNINENDISKALNKEKLSIEKLIREYENKEKEKKETMDIKIKEFAQLKEKYENNDTSFNTCNILSHDSSFSNIKKDGLFQNIMKKSQKKINKKITTDDNHKISSILNKTESLLSKNMDKNIKINYSLIESENNEKDNKMSKKEL